MMRAHRTPLLALAGFFAVGVLAGCGDKPQTLDPAQVAAPSFQGTGTNYAADGWKAGDETSWDEQMRRRAQGQNEYSRIVAQ